MYRPYYRASLWEVRDGMRVLITHHDFKTGNVHQMRDGAIDLVLFWESAEPTDRLFECTIELFYWWGEPWREHSVFIYCNDYALTAIGLAREAYIFVPWPEAKFHWVPMLEIIGNNLEQILLYGRIFEKEEFEELPKILQERSELTIGSLTQRKEAYERKRKSLAGEDDNPITIGDLPF